jgi:FlaA1/EpsC-like NDP-sugar epimerase
MVTGAGGSIGSELCRQIAAFGPSCLILFERYENGLYAIANELQERAPEVRYELAIGDVTDDNRLDAILDRWSPRVILHAAAHKHVPLMEYNCCEAVKNNVLGTCAVAAAAQRHGVERFVLISSDKAVHPSSVMGVTKRVAEQSIQAMAPHGTTRFITVRFGNVLGSNGSVVPRFLSQIRAGGPVTVTHPEMRRYRSRPARPSRRRARGGQWGLCAGHGGADPAGVARAESDPTVRFQPRRHPHRVRRPATGGETV